MSELPSYNTITVPQSTLRSTNLNEEIAHYARGNDEIVRGSDCILGQLRRSARVPNFANLRETDWVIKHRLNGLLKDVKAIARQEACAKRTRI